MPEPAEITVIFGDGAIPGTRTFIKPFSRIETSVEGLPAGAVPTARISGSDTTPILSLGIPKGDKGDTGPTGPRGPQGVKGDKGEPGGSETAIAEYFRRAASRPMQALAELGVPRPATSKPNSAGSKTGELIKDTSSGITYMWDGSRWRKWDTPTRTAAPITRGDYISSISVDYLIRGGMCNIQATLVPSTGISGSWKPFTINDPDLRPSDITPVAFWGGINCVAYLNSSGVLQVDSPGGLWGGYINTTFPIE